MKHRKTKLFILVLVLFLGIVVGAGGYFHRDLYRPLAHDKGDVYIEIPKGSSPYEILAKVQSEGIIKHAIPLWIYSRLAGNASHMKAGQYRFPSPISPITVLHK